MTKRYEIIEGSITTLGSCSRGDHIGRPYHSHVVKVRDTKTGKDEWRCNKHVYDLSPEVAHKLTMLDLEDIKKSQARSKV